MNKTQQSFIQTITSSIETKNSNRGGDSIFRKTNTSGGNFPVKSPATSMGNQKVDELKFFSNSNYHEDRRLLLRGLSRDFEFDNTRIMNSPYVLVKGKQHQELVREGIGDMGFFHNNSIDIAKHSKRPDFVKAMGH